MDEALEALDRLSVTLVDALAAARSVSGALMVVGRLETAILELGMAMELVEAAIDEAEV